MSSQPHRRPWIGGIGILLIVIAIIGALAGGGTWTWVLGIVGLLVVIVAMVTGNLRLLG